MRDKLRTKTVASAILAIVILCTLVIATFRSVDSIQTEAALVAQTQTVQTKLSELRATIIAAHSSQRAYILGGDDGYLVRYNKAVTDFEPQIAALILATRDNPDQKQLLQTLKPLVEEKFEILDQGIEARRNGKKMELPVSDAMIPQFDNHLDEKLKEVLSELNTQQTRLLQNRLVQNQNAIDQNANLRIVTGVGGSVIIGLLLIIFMSELRHKNRLEERFRVVVESLPNAVILVNNKGIIEMVNKYTEEIFAYQRDDIVGLPVEVLFPERFRNEKPEGGISVLSTPAARPLGVGREMYGQRKDGSEFPVETGLSPLDTNEGRKVLVSVVDITERKQLAERLYETLSLQAAIVESSADAIIGKTPDGVVTSWNHGAETIFGYSEEEAVGHKIADLVFPPLLVDEEQVLLQKIRSGERIRNYDTIRHRKDGSLVNVSVSLSPICNSAGEVVGISSIKRDITRQKTAEIEALRITEELRTSNRDLEQFAFIASHDLQEPLRAVTGCVELLQRRYQGQLDERADTYIGHIVNGAARMQRMIQDLLEFARLARNELSFDVFEMQDALKDALETLADRIQKSRAQVELRDLPSFFGNQGQFSRLFQNLLGNSLKFCPADQTPRIVISASNDEYGYTITVRDNGIGIQPEYSDRIFGLFQRLHTHDQYEGTGIGLAVCKRIVEFHRGTIWMNELPAGTGAEFAFFLPRPKNNTNGRPTDEQNVL